MSKELIAIRRLLKKYESVMVAFQTKEHKAYGVFVGQGYQDLPFKTMMDMLANLTIQCRDLVLEGEYIEDENFLWDNMREIAGIPDSKGKVYSEPENIDDEEDDGIDDADYEVFFPNTSMYGEKIVKELLGEYAAIMLMCQDAKGKYHAFFRGTTLMGASAFTLMGLLTTLVRVGKEKAEEKFGVAPITYWDMLRDRVKDLELV